MIHTGDCIEVMATLPADSVDAVVTDPPYALTTIGRTLQMSGESLKPRGDVRSNSRRTAGGFMGKNWDAPEDGTPWGFQAWCESWGREALRVTKPGGYLLACGGTRTHHRLVCGLEDAGWIIRDELDWIYASGFPKGKANLKPAHEPIVLARKPGPLRPLGIDECRIGTEQTVTIRSGHSGDHGKFGQDNRTFERVNDGRWPSNVLLSDPELFDQPNPYVVGSGATAGSVNKDFGQSGYRRGGGDGPSVGLAGSKNAPDSYGDTGGYSRFFKIPETGRDGFYGNAVGDSRFSGLPSDSIDRGSAGGTQDRPSNSESSSGRDSGGRLEDGDAEARPAGSGAGGSEDGRAVDIELHAGDEALADYPSHFLIPKADRADREPVLRGQIEGKRYGLGALASEQEGEYIDFVHPVPEGVGPWLMEQRKRAGLTRADVASQIVGYKNRQTVLALLSCWERDDQRPPPEQWRKLREIIGFDDRHDEAMTAVQPVSHAKRHGDIPQRENAHPTVKPTDLMRHLVRLVTPSGGTVLDPFLGSGSTAIACELEGFPWIGIEKESEYVAIAEARLNGVQRGLGLDVGAPTRRDIGKQRGNKDEDGRPTLKGPANLESSWFHSEPDEEPAA